jgi:predicted RNA-binding protein with PUA-like domain
MPGKWLFKTEPSDYSYDRLEKEGRAVWDGVTNALALKHLRLVRRGDAVLVYHTGDEKAVVGIARAASDARPDPNDRAGKLAVVDIEPERRLQRPVALSEIKARRDMAGFELVRMGRLSVMPVDPARWESILEMSRAAPPRGLKPRA